MKEWYRQDKIKTLKERMPDVEFERHNEEQTDSWNFLNCDVILGKYPDTYIKPMRKSNIESWKNVRLVLEDNDSVMNRCPPGNRPAPKNEQHVCDSHPDACRHWNNRGIYMGN